MSKSVGPVESVDSDSVRTSVIRDIENLAKPCGSDGKAEVAEPDIDEILRENPRLAEPHEEEIADNDDNDDDIADKSSIAYGYEDRFADVPDDNPYYKKASLAGEDKCALTTEIKKPSSLSTYNSDQLAILHDFVLRLIELLNQNDRIGKSADSDRHIFGIISRETLKEFSKRMRQHNISGLFKNVEIYYMYQIICREQSIDADKYRSIFQKKSQRSESGVMVFAVFTHPLWRSNKTGKMTSFSCDDDCSYCPQQPGRPRSYVDGEPGNDRAVSVNYDTIKQVYIRAYTYRVSGHVIDKAEVIVLGGTWDSYPMEYRREFARNLYYAFNTVNGNRGRPMLSLEEEMRINTCMDSGPSALGESAELSTKICRVIGLTIETRPDRVTANSLKFLREIGCTRVQIGIQHTDDRMLLRVNRGCTSADAKHAILNLKRCGFKITGHLMPDLPRPIREDVVAKYGRAIKRVELTKDMIDWEYDVAKADRKMFEEFFHSEDYATDHVKIYNFQVMDWTKEKDYHAKGLHVPYGDIADDDDPAENCLIKLLVDVKPRIPPYVRVERLKRDIPDSYSLGGLTDKHGRDFIKRLMQSLGLKCGCIRCNEIRKNTFKEEDTRLAIYKYRASGADEYFIYYTDSASHVIGFTRLRLDPKAGTFTRFTRSSSRESVLFPELVGSAMIRELHVYGEVVRVNQSAGESGGAAGAASTKKTHQHLGFGTRLIHAAFLIAQSEGYQKMSVIPGEGVKAYYLNKFNFVEDRNYMTAVTDTVDDFDHADKTRSELAKAVTTYGVGYADAGTDDAADATTDAAKNLSASVLAEPESDHSYPVILARLLILVALLWFLI